MNDFAFIGDEISASGFRLTGIQTYSPPPGQTAALFRKLMHSCRFIILSGEAAQHLPPRLLQQCAQQGSPLVLQVPDAGYRTAPPNLSRRIREKLGMDR